MQSSDIMSALNDGISLARGGRAHYAMCLLLHTADVGTWGKTITNPCTLPAYFEYMVIPELRMYFSPKQEEGCLGLNIVFLVTGPWRAGR